MAGSFEERSQSAPWLPDLYDCLHGLAERALQRESGSVTLQPTALVHEAYLQLVTATSRVEEEAKFMELAARVVRRVLIQHARARDAQKRGGEWRRITLNPSHDWSSDNEVEPIDLIALDEALQALERVNERAARVVELLFFSGLNMNETATALKVSTTTAETDWRFARAWLSRKLDGKQDE